MSKRTERRGTILPRPGTSAISGGGRARRSVTTTDMEFPARDKRVLESEKRKKSIEMQQGT